MRNEENSKMSVADIINIVIIVYAIVTRFIGFSTQTLNIKTNVVLTSSALLVGLIYTVYGRKQNVDMYYRLFMVLFTIGSGAAIVSPLIEIVTGKSGHGNMLTSRIFLAFNVIVFICSVVLTFVNSLNKKGAMFAGCIIFAINIVKVVRAFVSVGTISYIAANIGNLVVAYIICSFVKYRYENFEKSVSETTI